MPILLMRGFRTTLAVASLGAVAGVSTIAHAETPFIDQIPIGVTLHLPSNSAAIFIPSSSIALPNFTPTHQVATPHSPDVNAATTLEIGNFNRVTQMQNGIGDQSAVGIIGGNSNNVGVTQNGNNLQSNLLLIGTQGMHVNVVQSPNSPPVDMAVIHAPAATLIIKH